MVPVLTVPSPTPQKLCTSTQLCFNVTTVDTIITKLTYALLSGPGTINSTTGQVCFTPTVDGTFNWSVLVSDSCGKADTGAVSWNVDFVDAPTAVIAAPDGDTAVCVGTELTEYLRQHYLHECAEYDDHGDTDQFECELHIHICQWIGDALLQSSDGSESDLHI